MRNSEDSRKLRVHRVTGIAMGGKPGDISESKESVRSRENGTKLRGGGGAHSFKAYAYFE